MHHLPAFIGVMNTGASAPSVEASDLKHMWKLLQVKVESGESKMGIVFDGLETEFSPGANLPALCLRSALLQSFVDDGLLEGWIEEGE